MQIGVALPELSSQIFQMQRESWLPQTNEKWITFFQGVGREGSLPGWELIWVPHPLLCRLILPPSSKLSALSLGICNCLLVLFKCLIACNWASTTGFLPPPKGPDHPVTTSFNFLSISKFLNKIACPGDCKLEAQFIKDSYVCFLILWFHQRSGFIKKGNAILW